ncbi:MAG: hypothetical protein FJ190_03045 [Gammaproteobacteria bacterium]|nr:hypothetical protein [Gammaproteobacteria bacterium]
MNKLRWKLFTILVFGFSAPIWWTWAVSKLIYATYIMSGSPDRPTVTHLWGTVYTPSFLFGIVVGFVIARLSSPKPVKGWVLFISALAFAEVLINIVSAISIEELRLTLISTGNLFFFIGTALVPGVFAMPERNIR